jgi:hypothetical protein
MRYYNFPKPKAKEQSLPAWIDKVDEALSEVVRMTAADERGECECITCGKKEHWRYIQCGHFMKRRHMATRFEFQNCDPQCSTCNCVNDGREEDHGFFIDQKHGQGTADKLKRMANQDKKWTIPELMGLHKELTAEIKRLKAEKF